MVNEPQVFIRTIAAETGQEKQDDLKEGRTETAGMAESPHDPTRSGVGAPVQEEETKEEEEIMAEQQEKIS